MRSKLLMMAARGLSTTARRPLRGVVFDLDGSYIHHKTTGEQIWLHEKDGMYSLKLWVPTKGASGAGF